MTTPGKSRFASTRRVFLTRSSVAIAGVLAMPNMLAACSGKVPPMIVDATPANLTPWRFQTLAQLSEMIIPATDTPGSIGAGVPQFIDGLLTDWAKPETRALYEAGIDFLDEQAQSAMGKDFLELGSEEQVTVLTAVEDLCFGKGSEAAEADGPDPKAGYRELKKQINFGYYSSEVGCTQELQYELIPGPDARIDAPLEEVGRSWALAR